jgi:hypothetical protein
MTGHKCNEILKKAKKIKKVFEKEGLNIWSPVLKEKIPNKPIPLDVISKDDLLAKWEMDKKEGLANCHVIYDADGDKYSEGVSIERGYMRWYVWRPVIRRKNPGHPYSISNIEEDKIVYTHKQAAIYIKKNWGSRSKWVIWKLNHIIFGIPKFIYRQIKSLWL